MNRINRIGVIGCALLLAACQPGDEEADSPRVEPEVTSFDEGWSFRYFGPGDPVEDNACIKASRGSQIGHPALHAIDGNIQTRWCAPDARKGHQLELETGTTTLLRVIDIYWEKSTPQDVEIEVVYPGSVEKRTIHKETLLTRLPIGGRVVERVRINFPDTKSSAWASVREIILVDGEGKRVEPHSQHSPDEPAQPQYNAEGFCDVHIPHDWAIESKFLKDQPNETGKLPWNGYGWYRKSFDVPAEFSPARERYYLDFDGVMSHPQVYVNGKLAGQWAYGYSSFRVDITPFLKAGEKNLVAVMASNKPLSTRWYPGAGIYRHVRLVHTHPTHVAYQGICVRTPEISPEYAVVKIHTDLENTGTEPAVLRVEHSVGDHTTDPLTITLAPGETRTVERQLVLPKPIFWSCENPYLYTLCTKLSEGKKAPEVHHTRFGVRTVEWTPEGFFLNGRRVELHGVCEHHDLGALGTAFYRRAFERKVRLLKEMGCNAIRTAHNPPAPEVLDICDEQGVLVMDELFDIWEAQKYDKSNGYNLDWSQWWKKDVANFVRRDRNHPCVIAWSGGNEITEIFLPGGPEVSNELRDEFRKYDPTRPFTAGVNHKDGAWNGFGDTLDVFGFNYKPHLYGIYDVTRPNMPFFGAETCSCVGTRDTYFFPLAWDVSDGAKAFQVSSYGLSAAAWGNCPDIEFYAHDTTPRIAGEFVWTGFDYLGEPTPYNQDASNVGNLHGMTEEEKQAVMESLRAMGDKAPSRSSYFGIFDLAGFPKDIYYLYRSRWMPHEKFAHLLPHWNWPGREGKVIPVMCYSSGDEAELFVNGKSQGVRRKGEGDLFTQKDIVIPKNAYRFVWEDVVYEPGEIRVVVKNRGEPWAEDSRTTPGNTAKVAAEVDRDCIAGDGQDLCFIELSLTDEKGVPVLTDSRPVSFSISGEADLVGFCNGNPIDHTCMKDTHQHFFNGRILAIVRGRHHGSGKAEVTVSAEGLPEVKVPLQVQMQK